MNFVDYQGRAVRTLAGHPNPNMGIAILGLGLAGETGELVDHIKKLLGHGHQFDIAKVKEEAGDVLWYLAVLLDQFEITLDEVASENITKLERRYPDGFSQERSRNRDVIAETEPGSPERRAGVREALSPRGDRW